MLVHTWLSRRCHSTIARRTRAWRTNLKHAVAHALSDVAERRHREEAHVFVHVEVKNVPRAPQAAPATVLLAPQQRSTTPPPTHMARRNRRTQDTSRSRDREKRLTTSSKVIGGLQTDLTTVKANTLTRASQRRMRMRARAGRERVRTRVVVVRWWLCQVMNVAPSRPSTCLLYTSPSPRDRG